MQLEVMSVLGAEGTNSFQGRSNGILSLKTAKKDFPSKLKPKQLSCKKNATSVKMN